MATLLRMPASAAGVQTAIVSEWPVALNEAVRQGETVLVIETDKAQLDVPAETDGVLLRTLVDVGQSVLVGAPVAVLGERGEDVDVEAFLAAADVPVSSPVAATPDATSAAGPTTEPATPAAGEALAPPKRAGNGRIFSSPLARRRAAEHGIDITTVSGTGPGGRITRQDIERGLATAATAQPRPPGTTPGRTKQESLGLPEQSLIGEPPSIESIPHTRLREAIATRLVHSKTTVPHFYLGRSCQLDDLLALRAQANSAPDAQISINDLLVKAAGLAHRMMPAMDAIWTDRAVQHLGTTDIGIAINTERGLMTPVLRHAAGRTLTDLAAATRDLIRRAQSGQLRQAELEGGSITVSNLGMFGVEEFSAIINPPQSAILAVGAARRAPAVVDGEVRTATVMRVMLSVDHRIHDGALAAQWLDLFVRLVENPVQILI